LTAAVPDYFNLYALAVGFLLALAVVGIGAVVVVRRGLGLKKRVEPFKRLPFVPVLELTQARVDIATRSIGRVPDLIERSQRAVAAIVAARESVTASVLEARDFLRAMLSRG
jgi:hypothetical protein